MGQRPKDLTPHESVHHYWGAELRALRIARGLSLAELGQHLHCDPSYLAKIERAERPIPVTLAQSCDRVLDTQGTLVRLHALTESDRDLTAKPDRQAPHHVACDAVHVDSSTGSLTGGKTFPMTPGTGDEIVVPARTSDGRVVFVSVPRRVFLHGLGSAALGLTAIQTATPAQSITLPADINPIEHFQQLRQTLIQNDRLFGPRQVIPIVREQIGIMQQLRTSWRGADHQELVRVQAQYTEFCGWLYQDAGEHLLAESCIDRALGLSHMAADPELTAYTLGHKAHLAGDMRASVDAIGAGEQALSLAPPRSRLSVLVATCAAYGYALSGDRAATQRAYDRARELHRSMDADPDSPYGSWVSEKWIDLSQARSLTDLGNHRAAAESFHAAIVDLPNDRRRDRGVYLARAALAEAGDRQVEHAATLGLDALAIGTETRSARILTELAHLDEALIPYHTVPAVADFRIAVKDTISPQA